MNFIVEFLPKMADGTDCIVVRSGNGFPMGTFDTLDSACSFMSFKRSEFLKKSDKAHSDA